MSEASWLRLPAADRAIWRTWRQQHPDEAWKPLCHAIIDCGYWYPPTEAETDILWPIVDARPNDAAVWFREAAKPQGLLRMQPSWIVALRGVTTRWEALSDTVPEDEIPDLRIVRADDSKEVLKRIGWFRSG